MSDTIASEQRLDVRHGTLFIGDANFPPRGACRNGVPDGACTWRGTLATSRGATRLKRFVIEWAGSEATVREKHPTSVDGGIFAVATTWFEGAGFWERRRSRARLSRELDALFSMDVPVIPISLGDAAPRMIAACAGDGEFDVVAERDASGSVVRVYCDLY